jgi:hypothetical protein
MKTQLRTKQGKATTAMRCAAFVRGFKDKRAGKAFVYDAYPTTNDQWNYERGRQFACIYDGALKNGQKLTWQAQRAMQDALFANAIN